MLVCMSMPIYAQLIYTRTYRGITSSFLVAVTLASSSAESFARTYRSPLSRNRNINDLLSVTEQSRIEQNDGACYNYEYESHRRSAPQRSGFSPKISTYAGTSMSMWTLFTVDAEYE
ncbi:hypothetical protein DENSPDRAFT_354993 [Dentipellis sp. KUC8613]|nr:hypothetical protein DENSPDRAFT_354993 [Dentipellis sp. KUC8613]